MGLLGNPESPLADILLAMGTGLLSSPTNLSLGLSRGFGGAYDAADYFRKQQAQEAYRQQQMDLQKQRIQQSQERLDAQAAQADAQMQRAKWDQYKQTKESEGEEKVVEGLRKGLQPYLGEQVLLMDRKKLQEEAAKLSEATDPRLLHSGRYYRSIDPDTGDVRFEGSLPRDQETETDELTETTRRYMLQKEADEKAQKRISKEYPSGPSLIEHDQYKAKLDQYRAEEVNNLMPKYFPNASQYSEGGRVIAAGKKAIADGKDPNKVAESVANRLDIPVEEAKRRLSG